MTARTGEGRGQWPSWVYGVGETPDHRFSLANERTFLAWVRTSLALVAGGVALDAVNLDGPAELQTVLAAFLVVLGLIGAAVAWLRWAAAERAMRLRRPLPGTAALAWLALALVVVAACLVVLVL
ncbi:YidH family protein [Nocardioides sp.]|uniref:YidH family protein n=1 Tax=Nocardioides sp. TaxID=35761 RepID=UPI002ED39287